MRESGSTKMEMSDVQASYDLLADQYVQNIYDELRHKPFDRELLDRFAASIPLESLVCDIGTGPGHVARYLPDRGTKVCGIDLAPEMVDSATRLNPGIEFRQGNMFALDNADKTFGGMTAFYALVGSAQAAKSVQYVASELKAIGCEVQLERVMVPHWVRGDETAALVQFPGQAENTTQKIVLCALGASVATPADGIIAEVITVRNFDELKALPRDKVAGKIVLFNYPFDKQMAGEGHGDEAYGEEVVYLTDGPSAAERQGSVACLIRSVGGADYRLPHTGQTSYADDAPKIPAGAVTAEDADLIVDLVRQGPVKMKLTITPQQLPDVESYNVIGDITGSERPEQVIIVSGHLDSWDLGTGAIDDAAGVAVSMEAANLIQKLHFKPKRTIRVIAWMNEENGSAGSKKYAAEHASDLANHLA